MRILPGKKGFGQPISQASMVFRVWQRSGSPVRGDIFVVAPSPLIFQLRRSDIGSRLRPKTSRGSNLLLVDSTENSEEPFWFPAVFGGMAVWISVFFTSDRLEGFAGRSGQGSPPPLRPKKHQIPALKSGHATMTAPTPVPASTPAILTAFDTR